MNNKKVYTTKEVANLLNADVSTISNWIDEGHLAAYRTPGGHRRVRKKSLLEFSKEYNMPIFKSELSEQNFLIVDDEEHIRNTVKKVLKKKFPKAHIYEAASGFSAGKILARGDIGYVILDIRMPGIDGLDLMDHIKNDSDLGSPSIIVITGYPREGLEEEIKRKGAKKLLIKPFDIKDLRKAVDEIVRE
ncbi:MAG: response regulator [Elusimicrobiota bacterium]